MQRYNLLCLKHSNAIAQKSYLHAALKKALLSKMLQHIFEKWQNNLEAAL